MDVSRSLFHSIVVVVALALDGAASAQTVTFTGQPVGALPGGFLTERTGKGQPGRWQVIEDAGASGGRALAQLAADRTDHRYPLAILESVDAANVEITARFKPVSGQIDRAGGVVVRWRDADNYYVARANALEDNVRFYRVIGGNRQQLATADVKVASGQWHSLTLRAQGDRFTVTFDGKTMHVTTDRTLTAAGKTGLWTKADSVTYFERIDVKVLP